MGVGDCANVVVEQTKRQGPRRVMVFFFIVRPIQPCLRGAFFVQALKGARSAAISPAPSGVLQKFVAPVFQRAFEHLRKAILGAVLINDAERGLWFLLKHAERTE